MDDPAAQDAFGVHDEPSMGSSAGLVNQAAHGGTGEHAPVHLLVDEIGRLAAENSAGTEDVGPDLAMGGFHHPPLVNPCREPGGRRGAVVEQGGGEHHGLVAALDLAGNALHRKFPASSPAVATAAMQHAPP